MGLNINTFDQQGNEVSHYERLGSYGTLHILRKWVLEKIEGNSKELIDKAYSHIPGKADKAWEQLKIVHCPALIDHSDCDGGYMSYSVFKVKNPTWEWADLDKLWEEMIFLKTKTKEMDEDTLWVFNRLWEILDMRDEKEGRAVKVEFT